jgi:hypothetical protein
MRLSFHSLVRFMIVGIFAGLMSACVPHGEGMSTSNGTAKPGAAKEIEGAYLATKDANIDIPALPIEEIPSSSAVSRSISKRMRRRGRSSSTLRSACFTM